MEVDPPTSSGGTNPIPIPVVSGLATPGSATLKRSNSAPMINVLPAASPVPAHVPSPSLPTPSPSSSLNSSHEESPATSTSSSNIQISHPSPNSASSSSAPHLFKPLTVDTPRTRRFSASYAVGLHSPTGGKTPSRLVQIKHEESVPQKDREVAHERELQSTIQISMSCDELRLEEEEPMVTDAKRPKSLGEPLHILTSFPYSSTPSPTRIGKQCFSPSLQQPIKNSTLTPSPSPSPTRKTFARRSLSPITLRPSPLSGIKRKADFDDYRLETCFSPPKKILHGSLTPDRVPVSNPLIRCLSNPGIEESSHIEQSNNLSSSHLPIASLSSPTPASCFSFRPVSADNSNTTDSEASDANESTDMGDNASNNSPGSAGSSRRSSTNLPQGKPPLPNV